MTRTHAATSLLALGPLTFSEFVMITGWTVYQCRKTLGHLQSNGRIDNEARGVYVIYP